jgi:hypothetical protein
VPWIKKILQRIYDRFEDAFLLGEPTKPSGHGRRGPEKKKYVINYVRTNPQELRPFEPRAVLEARMRTRKARPEPKSHGLRKSPAIGGRCRTVESVTIPTEAKKQTQPMRVDSPNGLCAPCCAARRKLLHKSFQHGAR